MTTAAGLKSSAFTSVWYLNTESCVILLELLFLFNVSLYSYVNEGENQMVVSGESVNTVELFGGSELVITKRTENKVTSRTLGSREFMRYYRQKPPPSSQKHIVNSLTSRFVFDRSEIITLTVSRISIAESDFDGS